MNIAAVTLACLGAIVESQSSLRAVQLLVARLDVAVVVRHERLQARGLDKRLERLELLPSA